MEGERATVAAGGQLTGDRVSEDRLSEDEVAAVFARAAELDADRPPGPDVLLDVAAVEEVGRQVGLSADAIHRAVGELRAGLLTPAAGPPVLAPPAITASPAARLVGPPTTVVVRTLAGPAEEVHQRLAGAFRSQLLEARRHHPLRSAWVPQRGLAPSLRRSLDFGGRLQLTAVERLEVALTAAPARPAGAPSGPGAVVVRIEAHLEGSRRRLGAGMALGGGWGAATSTLAAAADETAFAALGAVAAGVGGVGWLAARSSYRRSLGAVEEALEGVLDRIEHRSTRRPVPPRPVRP